MRPNLQDVTRAFCARCSDVGAWDGINTYFYTPSAVKMGRTYNNLKKLSTILQVGNFKVSIL